ncbi:Zinc finger protein CONSTANS-LIKE 4 [Nymphaea thermarum]|nr:Zinc finger protein CONSTANS-LIKE 4 [Nymphaea thermarum]
MAHALYGADAGWPESRQVVPISTPKAPSDPIPVPSAAAGRRWSPAMAAYSLQDSWTEVGPGMNAAVAALQAFSSQESPENSPLWPVPLFRQNAFSEFLPSSLFQRSLSSQSLEQLSPPLPQHKCAPFRPFFGSPVQNSVLESELSDAQSSPPTMRKVFSTGDLQKLSLGHESGSPSGHEHFCNGMQKVARYNAEEKKERIQRYRSKRNQRNFNKKITYACRKTLADSRPRVRGRFARNEEHGESSAQVQWNQIEDEDDEESWMHLFDANYIPIP